MLHLQLKNTLAAILLFFGVIGIAYISKPDRGGLRRCQEIFGLDSLEGRGAELRPFLKWKPFETTKFRMKVGREKVTDLKNYLVRCGYTKWVEGGIQYGSLNMGWDSTTKIYYSKKQIGRHVHIMAYDMTNDLLYAIVSQ